MANNNNNKKNCFFVKFIFPLQTFKCQPGQNKFYKRSVKKSELNNHQIIIRKKKNPSGIDFWNNFNVNEKLLEFKSGQTSDTNYETLFLKV